MFQEQQPDHPLNVGGDLHPTGQCTGEAFFRFYTPELFVQESIQRWRAFVDDALHAEAITVLDSYPFQNSVRVLLQLDAHPDFIREYAGQVEALVMPLRPVLIYLNSQDAVQSFLRISEQRGQEWTDYVVRVVLCCPYATARHLEGINGVLAFLADYKKLTDALLRQSQLPRLVLDGCSCSECWQERHQQIAAFLAGYIALEP